MKNSIFIALSLVAGCATNQEIAGLVPAVQTSPVDCGYQWFQSGYSPPMQISCDVDRTPLRDAQNALAREHAWEVAASRCPESCAPVELEYSGESDRSPNGVCRNGYAYFSEQVFFQCGM
jgi:hypothetical protein